MKRIKNEIRRILAWILAWLFCVSAGMPPAMAYSNEDGPYFDTLLEARNYLQQCIGEIQEEISFRLPDDLLNEMGESELKRELLLDNPTQGIDVGSKAEIYQLILKLAESGKTILINTLEINEIQKVADRCAVFYDGELLKILAHDEIDEHTVMMYSTNAVQAMEE